MTRLVTRLTFYRGFAIEKLAHDVIYVQIKGLQLRSNICKEVSYPIKCFRETHPELAVGRDCERLQVRQSEARWSEQGYDG